MNLQILPLAITMMLGPQIMSAIIFVTTPKAVRVSVPFLAGVAIATTVGTAVLLTLQILIGGLFGGDLLGDPSDSSSVGNVVQYALVGLLIVLAVKSYLGRETAEPPAWLGTLQSADPRLALKTGLLVILLMPSDIIIMLTVATNLAQNDAGLLAALPFVAATVFIAALPLLLFLLFHRRAEQFMPKVRDWMNANSWLVNIIVYVVFVVIILFG